MIENKRGMNPTKVQVRVRKHKGRDLRKFEFLLTLVLIFSIIFQILPVNYAISMEQEIWINTNIPNLPVKFLEFRGYYTTIYTPWGSETSTPYPIDQHQILGASFFDFEQSGEENDMVVFQRISGSSIVRNGTTRLSALDWGGYLPPYIGDFDQDGIIDDISTLVWWPSGYSTWYGWSVGGNGTATYENYSKVFRAYQIDDGLLTTFVVGVSDFDGDGYANDVVNYIGSGSDLNWSLKVFQVGSETTPFWEYWPAFNSSGANSIQDLAIGDFDGDGGWDDVIVAFHFNASYMFNSEGTILWNFTTTAPIQGIQRADLNNDGIQNELVMVGRDSYIWTFDGLGNPIWNWTSVGPLCSVEIGNLDNIGGDDIIVGGYDGILTAFNSSGDLLWSKNITGGDPIVKIETSKLYDPFILDEIVFSTGIDAGLFCVNASGSSLWNITCQVGNFFEMGDWDGNGLRDDILTFSGLYMYLYKTEPINITSARAEIVSCWSNINVECIEVTITTDQPLLPFWNCPDYYQRSGYSYMYLNQTSQEFYKTETIYIIPTSDNPGIYEASVYIFYHGLLVLSGSFLIEVQGIPGFGVLGILIGLAAVLFFKYKSSKYSKLVDKL